MSTLWYSNTGDGNVFWVLRCKTATMTTEVQSYMFIITCAHSGTCISYSSSPVHNPCWALSLHTALVLNIGGQTVSGCWTIAHRWYREELFMWMFASKITAKYPQTHNYCTWFYLTKLLTSRTLAFPAALLLAGTPFCLFCSAAGRKQMPSFKQKKLPSTDSGKHTGSRYYRMTQVQSSAPIYVLFST